MTGRQKLYGNFASQSGSKQFAVAIERSANTRRTFGREVMLSGSLPGSLEPCGPKIGRSPERTASVCAAVRVLLFAPPTSLVSL